MRRRAKQCDTCPFRGMPDNERRLCAAVEPEEWSCHSENFGMPTDIQCRGHFEARRKYPPTPEAIAALESYRTQFSASLSKEE